MDANTAIDGRAASTPDCAMLPDRALRRSNFGSNFERMPIDVAAVQVAANNRAAHLDRPAASAERTISFGPFVLFPKQWLLLKADKSIRLGSRALDILITLLEHPGELVSKEELMARVWPHTFVEPANLTVHIAALRRALGDGRGGNRYLVNVPGRGYRFVTPVFIKDEPTHAAGRSIATNGPRHPSVRDTKPVGRVETSRALALPLPQERIELGSREATALPAMPRTIEIEFATGARMRITGLIDASTIQAMVTALAAVPSTPSPTRWSTAHGRNGSAGAHNALGK